MDAWRLKSQQGTRKSCAPEFLILSDFKLPLYTLVVFININTCIVTEGRHFKTFLKENYVIALDSCYIFTKNIEHGMIMKLIVLMEFSYIYISEFYSNSKSGSFVKML